MYVYYQRNRHTTDFFLVEIVIQTFSLSMFFFFCRIVSLLFITSSALILNPQHLEAFSACIYDPTHLTILT